MLEKQRVARFDYGVGDMKPQSLEVLDVHDSKTRVKAEFSAEDTAGVMRMVNRMLAYTYEVDSRSDDDIPVLLAEKVGIEQLEEDRNQMAPSMLAPFVVDALGFETILDPEVVEASALSVGAPYVVVVDVVPKPAYELSSYEPVHIVLPKARFDEEELTGFMAAIADEHASFAEVPEGEPVKPGDRVTVDMETYGDYGPVPALCRAGARIAVGEGWLAPEFDENLIGAKAGQKLRFAIRALTEASADEDDAEKLNVTVVVAKVERPERIDITDEWVAENIEGASSVAEFEQLVQNTMIQGTAQPQNEEQLLARVAEALAERLDAQISDELYQQTVNDMLAQMDQAAYSEQLTFEDYLGTLGLSMETLGDYLMSRARSQLLQGFALDAYFRHFDLTIEDSDIDCAASRMIGSDRLDAVDSLRRQYELAGKSYALRELARRLKANTHALECALVSYE